MKYRHAAYDMNMPDPIYRGGNAKMDAMIERFGLNNYPKVEPQAKLQGVMNRSGMASIVLAAKDSWGEVLDIQDKLEIESLAKEVAIKMREAEASLKDGGGKFVKNKHAIEMALRKMVSDAGLGKLASKGFLRNGKQSKLRASQLMLAVEAGNTEE